MPSGATCFAASCSETVDQGVSVQLFATPESDSRYSWSGCTSVSGGRCTVSMTGNKSVTANFKLVIPPGCPDLAGRNAASRSTMRGGKNTKALPIPVCP